MGPENQEVEEDYRRRFHIRSAPPEAGKPGWAMLTIPATDHSLREHRFLDADDVLALYEELRAVVPKPICTCGEPNDRSAEHHYDGTPCHEWDVL